MPPFLRLAGQMLVQVRVLVKLNVGLLWVGNQALSGQFAQMVRLLLLLRVLLLLWTAFVCSGRCEGHDLLGPALLRGRHFAHLEEDLLRLPVECLLGLLDARDGHLVGGLGEGLQLLRDPSRS